ncbi:hypothetical protein L914_07096, partial [Phytophthora nicotianae]
HVSYERILRALVKYVKLFFELDVNIRSASNDHSDAITSELEMVWPHVEVLTCYEQCLKQTRLKKRKGFAKDIVKSHIWLLHKSRSLKQPKALSKTVIKAWESH